MSKYRSVQVSFWQDAFVLDLTPEEKYFYIYLMTNSKANQIGIYELPKRIIETETGYNRETVDKLLKRFIEYKKVEYDDSSKELFLMNWARYNWNNSPKVVTRVIQELGLVKNQTYSERYINSALEFNTSQQFKEYGYGIHTVSKGYVYKEKEKEKEKEKDNKQQTSNDHLKNVVVLDGDYKSVIDFVNNNIQPVTPHIGETIDYWLKDMPVDVVLEALKLSIEANARAKIKYTESILKNWSDHLVKTLDDVRKLNKVSGDKGGTSNANNRESNQQPIKTYSDGLNF